ncbi:hypothetical protein AHAS_Ahas02G0257300 [Arachis hypogaea]
MPKGMSKLKNLQFLSDYVVGKRRENKITELGALSNLHQSISISKLENVVNSSEASMARMFNKDGIRYLKLSWSPDEDENEVDSQIESDILDELQPHCNLKELKIGGYRGTIFPDCAVNALHHSLHARFLFSYSFRLELESTSCVKGLLLPDMMKSTVGTVYSIPLKDTAHMGNNSIFSYPKAELRLRLLISKEGSALI